MEEIYDENLDVLTDPVEEPTEEPVEEAQLRQNPFCVISKDTYGDYAMHDIQTNSGWSGNPYGDSYAVVPDEMVPEIMETRGFCDIELNEDGTELVSFTAREIPEPKPEPMTAEEARAKRDKLLAETDWTQVLDAPISAECREAFRVYRQALRDITEQEGFPSVIEWPVKPEVVKADPDPVDTAVDAMLEV